jgi:hypothetical protein
MDEYDRTVGDVFDFELTDDKENTNAQQPRKPSLSIPLVQSSQPSNIQAIPAASLAQPNLSLTSLLHNYKCADIIPDSGKIVVLDTALGVKAAFKALEENNIKSAPLWDSKVQDYIGMITVTDFIEILLHFHKEQPTINIFNELAKHQINTWRGTQQSQTSIHLPGTTFVHLRNAIFRNYTARSAARSSLVSVTAPIDSFLWFGSFLSSTTSTTITRPYLQRP